MATINRRQRNKKKFGAKIARVYGQMNDVYYFINLEKGSFKLIPIRFLPPSPCLKPHA